MPRKVPFTSRKTGKKQTRRSRGPKMSAINGTTPRSAMPHMDPGFEHKLSAAERTRKVRSY